MAREARRRERQAQDARRRAVRRRRGAAALALLLLPATAVWALAFKSPDGAGRDTATTAPPASSDAGRRLTEPTTVRGVRVPAAVAGDASRLRRIIAAAEPAAGLNTLVVDVKAPNGRLAFPVSSKLAPKAAATRTYDPRAVVAAAHAAGLYIVARISAFQDPLLARSRPDLAVRRAGTKAAWRAEDGAVWVDPSNPDTWRYILDVARAAGAAGFDEVDLADVRFPSAPDDATAVYARPKAPRTRVIAEFLRQAADELHADGVRLSVEALGLAATKDLGVGQDPVLIKQIADVISPTLFPTGFAAWQLGIGDPGANPHDTVLQALIDWRHTLVNGGAELRPWLQDFSTSTRTYGAREVAAQVAAVRDAGADGYLLANPDGRYSALAVG